MEIRRFSTAIGFVLGVVLLIAFPVGRGAVTGQQPPTAGAQGGRGGRVTPARERAHIIEGTKADDVLDGADADDWLFGYEGHDVMRGVAGRDTLDGGGGDDFLVGGAGQDVLDGGPGRDNVFGGDDNDFMDGGDDDDSLDGGAGNDDVDGGDGDDVLAGGAGDDALVGGDGNDTQSGGDGVDRVLGRDGDDRLSGGPGDDVVEGGDGRDTLAGDNGNDAMDGGEGDDVARGGLGDDVVKGESGNDILIGENGNDTLLGSRGDDNLDGGDDHDTLLGGDGRDTLTGGQGDDVLAAGLGSDTVRGDSENDLIIVRAGDVRAGEFELIDGGAGSDTLILNGFPAHVAALAAGQTVGDRTIVDPITGGTYRLISVEQIQHAHLFTGVGGSESNRGSFVVINPSADAPAAGRIVFFSNEGVPIGQSSFTVPPGGRLAPDAPASAAPATRGAALVVTDRPIGGHDSRLLESFMIPVHRAADGSDTGVAIFASTARTNAKVTLHRTTGEELATANQGAVEIDIPANGQKVVFVSELFAWAGDDFQGTLTIEGGIDRPQDGGPLAGYGLQRYAKAGALTTFPVIPIAPADSPRPIHFATFPVGGDYRSTITLVNPSTTTRARGALAFYDPAGQSRTISINSQTAAATVPFDIAPLGSMVFAAVSSGAVRPGSAQAVLKEGQVGGVARVTSTAGTYSAPPSEVATGLLAPAQRNRASNINTHVALNSQTPVTVTLLLRDARGAEVPGGRTQLQLAANASVAQALDALFPKVDTNDWQGTLSITADGGLVAATVTHVAADAIAVLPVVARRD